MTQVDGIKKMVAGWHELSGVRAQTRNLCHYIKRSMKVHLDILRFLKKGSFQCHLEHALENIYVLVPFSQMERAFTVYTKCRCFLTAFLPSPSLPVCLICSCVWLVLVFFSSPVARRYLGWVQPLLEDLSYALWRIHKVPKPRSLPLPLVVCASHY